jgi:hypothetical protein
MANGETMDIQRNGLKSRSLLICWWAFVLTAVPSAQGCTTLERRTAVPETTTEQAVTPGVPNSRYWVDTDLTPMAKDALESVRREKATLLAEGKSVEPMPPAYFLEIFGGALMRSE